MTGIEITRAAYDVLDQVTWDATSDGSLRDSYSGRGMYGRTCLALVVDDLSDLIRWLFGVANAVDGEEPEVAEPLQELLETITTGRTRHDNMGLQQVFYWTNVQVQPRT